MQIKDVKVTDFSEESKIALSKLPPVKNKEGKLKVQVDNYTKQFLSSNEKLCKLLGIPIGYKVVIEGMKKPKPCWFMTGETFATKEGAQNFIDTIVDHFRKASIREFEVDLKKPSNFVKLLEICHKSSYWKFDSSDFSGYSVVDGFINLLIGALDTEARTNDAYRLQTLAQQTKWEY